MPTRLVAAHIASAGVVPREQEREQKESNQPTMRAAQCHGRPTVALLTGLTSAMGYCVNLFDFRATSWQRDSSKSEVGAIATRQPCACVLTLFVTTPAQAPPSTLTLCQRHPLARERCHCCVVQPQQCSQTAHARKEVKPNECKE